jgi:hypothetical protein
MSKKSAKSKKEEALAFLDDLDKLGEEDSTEASSVSLTADQGQTQAGSSEGKGKASMDIPRKSVDSSRSAVNPGAGTGTVPPAKGRGSKKALTGSASAATSNPSTTTSAGGPGSISTSADKTTTGTSNTNEEDPEAALAYLQAQIDQKNRPISRVQTPTTTSTPSIARPATPSNQSATIGSILPAPTTTRKSIEQTRSRAGTPLNEPTSTTTSSDPVNTTNTNSSSGGGWGFWSSALQTAKSTASSAYTQASQVASAAQSAALAQAEKSGVNLNVNDYVPVGADLKGLKGLNLEELKKAGSGGLEALRTRVGEGVKGVDLERLRELSFFLEVGIQTTPSRPIS